MARTTPGVTKEHILDEAVRLFSNKGYAATSVGEIQAACGLAPGSGSLYKHFSSKQALLEEAVGRDLRLLTERSREAVEQPPDDPRAALELLADLTWATIESERDLIRIMIREFDNFPDLFTRMWEGVLATVYQQCATWIRSLHEHGRVRVADPDATASVLVSSLTYFPILKGLIHHTPGDMDPERFRAAWIDHAERSLRLS